MVRVVWDVTFARERMNTQPPITPFLIPAVVLILVAAVRDVRARALIVVGAVYLTIFSFLPQDSRYLASLLPRHDPAPDWPAVRQSGLGELLAHHVALAAPERILFLGRNIPPLLGHDMAQGPAGLRDFNHDSLKILAMGASGLADMLRSAKRRERFWRCWLDWTYGETKPH